MQIQPNSHVTLDYTLKDASGGLLDESDGEGNEPIRYVHGYGMLVPGLESALVGLEVGDARDIVVPAEAGFGERDEELVLEVDRSEMPRPAEVAPGDELVAESPEGEEVPLRVVEVKSDSVVVDATLPLAGVTLHYVVKVREIRAATDEEVAAAAEAYEEAVAGYGDGDGDEGADPGLVQLGTKKPRESRQK